MKKLKKALLVVPVACLALSLGAFAAACSHDDEPETPTHTHEYTVWHYDDFQHWQTCAEDDEATEKADHEYNQDDVCKCGAKKKTEIIDIGGAPFTVKGLTNVAFVKDIGTYEMLVGTPGVGLDGTDKEYKITIGTNEYTVNAENSTFVFNVNPDDTVHVYNPTAETVDSDAMGVKMTIVPKADYSDGENAYQFQYTIKRLSTRLKNGFTDISVDVPIMHEYAVTSNFGEYTFKFDVEEGNEYAVEILGQTKTINAQTTSFTVNLQNDNADAVQTTMGGTSYLYLLKFTPAAGNTADGLTVYAAQPKQEIKANYEDMFLVSSSINPDLCYIYNGEVDVEFDLSEGEAPFALVGETYSQKFSVFVGTDEVGKFESDVPNGSKANVNLDLNFKDGHIVDGKVTLTFKFDVSGSDDTIYLYASVSKPAEEVDNSELTLGETIFVAAADKNNNDEYVYTFTASEDGTYAVKIFGNSTVRYEVGEKTGYLCGWQHDVISVELHAGDTITIKLTSENSSDVIDSSVEVDFAVTETEIRLTLGEKYYSNQEDAQLYFYAEEDGKYTVTLHEKAENWGIGNAEIYVEDWNGFYFDEDISGSSFTSAEVELKAGEWLCVYLKYDGIEVTINKA